MKKTIEEKCIKCKANDWEQELIFCDIKYTCKKCGYVFDWLDYITASKINASILTEVALDKFLFQMFKI